MSKYMLLTNEKFEKIFMNSGKKKELKLENSLSNQ